MPGRRVSNWKHDATTLVPLGRPRRRAAPQPRVHPRVIQRARSQVNRNFDDMKTLIDPPFRFRDDGTIELDLCDLEIVAEYDDPASRITLCE